jgi:amino acid adenylation domain-containing protein
MNSRQTLSERMPLSLAADAQASAPGTFAADYAVPAEWLGQTVPFPGQKSVVDFVREHARLQPEASAVQDTAGTLSYGELNRQASLVAKALRNHGLRPDEPVVITVPASGGFVAGILGILKAGGCYLPIDVDTPPKRIEFILADCQARVVLSDPATRNRFNGWPGVVLDLAQIIGQPGEVAEESAVSSYAHRLAYVLYTSGSTGQPKGVEIEHHSLTNLVCHFLRHFQLTPKDRSSMLAHLAFDASVGDIWPVLCAGGTVVVPPREIRMDPDGLIRWLERQEVTVSFVPTGLAEILLTRSWPEKMKLRYLLTGGDRLRIRPPAGLSFTFINGYGPTEVTVFATFSVVTPAGDGPPPIGRPLDNLRTYVLDEKRQPLPMGAAGELYLGGEQVARGYFGRPELTRERFVPDPFSRRPAARMYCTGDWVRWRPDGELEFLGRQDDQIKIRGYRVELGEIEAVLFAHDAVRQVCCVPRLIDGLPSAVIAHVVPEHREGEVSEILRAYLQAQLPEYMVPAQFVLHERLPLTPQGKPDRAAMSAMKPENQATSDAAAPGDGVTQALENLWQTLLPAARSSPPDATFAMLGGDSLLAVRLMLGVEEITGQPLEVSTFLIQPTFAGLCQAVRTRMARAGFQPVLTLRKSGTRPPLFFLYGHNGDIDFYFNLAAALGEDQPIYGIRSPVLEHPSRLPASIEAAAAEVVGFIRKIQPAGAPALVGYSWAGLLAFEVARQFAGAGGVRCFTAVIGTDSPPPPTSFFSRLGHLIRHFPRWFWRLMTDAQGRRHRLAHWRKMARGTAQSLAEVSVAMPDWAQSPVSRHLIGLIEKYRPLPPAAVTVEVFRERHEYVAPVHPLRAWQTHHLPDNGWNRWTRQPNRIYWVAADHLTILKPPAVAGLAQALRAAMDQHRP